MMVNHSFRALGTSVHIQITDHRFWTAFRSSREMEFLFRYYENRFSRFKRRSELSVVNGSPHRWVAVSQELFEILSISAEAFKQTEGIFNPSIGRALIESGYDRSFEKINKEQSSPDQDRRQPQDAQSKPGSDRSTKEQNIDLQFVLDGAKRSVFLKDGCTIDLGGIAKSWIVEQAAHRLQKRGISRFICNAGGDLIARGSTQDIWIEHPLEPTQSIHRFSVTNQSVATSGVYKRRWGGAHHLIDPRTGYPSKTDALSCSVVHKSLMQAEIMAKTAVILGVEQGTQWLSSCGKDVDWVMVDTNGRLHERSICGQKHLS